MVVERGEMSAGESKVEIAGLSLQVVTDHPDLPQRAEFERWITLAQGNSESGGASAQRGEVTIRLVDREESAQLNRDYRQRQGATNVLSFPAAGDELFKMLPDEERELGDLVICAPLVAQQAQQQGKSESAHWAHLTIHGVLHLRGFDHQNDAEREQMEAVEIALLAQLGIENPYLS